MQEPRDNIATTLIQTQLRSNTRGRSLALNDLSYYWYKLRCLKDFMPAIRGPDLAPALKDALVGSVALEGPICAVRWLHLRAVACTRSDQGLSSSG